MQDPQQAVPTPVQDLVEDALEGRLALPEFQRNFAWNPRDVRLLLSSVALGWPIGSFMIWSRGELKLQSKDFDGVSGVKIHEDAAFLLDGQQRLTALIQAFHPQYSRYRYFINGLAKFLNTDADVEIEDYIDSLTEAQFAKRYPTLDDQAGADVAQIADIADDGKFERWIGSYQAQHPDYQGGSLFGLRQLRLPGLKSISSPAFA